MASSLAACPTARGGRSARAPAPGHVQGRSEVRRRRRPRLPNIHLPDAVDTDFELVLRLYNDVTIGPYQFEVTTAPGEAVRWHLVTPAFSPPTVSFLATIRTSLRRYRQWCWWTRTTTLCRGTTPSTLPPTSSRDSLFGGVDADQNEEDEEEEEEGCSWPSYVSTAQQWQQGAA